MRRNRIWRQNLSAGWFCKENWNFQKFDFHEHATSDFGSQISRPTGKIRSWKFDGTLPFYLEKVEDYDTKGIELMKSIRTQWFWSKLLVAIRARDFSHFGPNAESASHHEHRWVRSTLRTQNFFFDNFIFFWIFWISDFFPNWCEALSAVRHFHEMSAAQMTTNNFDQNHWDLILFINSIPSVS